MLIGCVFPVKLDDFKIEQPAKSKIPLRVGLYLSPKVCNYVHVAGNFRISLGEGVCSNARGVLRNVFNEVILLDEKESDLAKHGIKAVVSPEIIETEIIEGAFGPHGDFLLTCKWTITSADGKILYMDTVKGIGSDSSFLGSTRFSRNASITVKDHYQKLISHMLSSRWWEDIF